MSADLATLTLAVDATPGIEGVKRYNAELDNHIKSADGATQATKKQDQQLRGLAERMGTYADTMRRAYEQQLKQNGLWERYTQIVRQLDDEERQMIAREKELAAAQSRVEETSNKAGVGLRALRSPLATLASQALNVNSSLGQLGSILSSFAVGTVATASILAGVGAIAFAYDKLTSSARKAREEADRLTESLLAEAKARHAATSAGQEEIARQAQQNADQALGSVAFFGALAATGGLAGQVEWLTRGRSALERYGQAAEAASVAQGNFRRSLGLDFGSLAKAVTENLDKLIDRAGRAGEAERAEAKRTARERKRLLDEYYDEQDRMIAEGEARNAQAFDKFVKDYVDALTQAAKEHDEFLSRIGLNPNDIKKSVERDVKTWAGGDIVDYDVLKRIGDAKKYAEDISQIWRDGFNRIITDGTKSFRDFFEDVLRMFSSLMSRMQKEGKNSGTAYRLLGLGSSAIAGGFAGYQFGQQTDSRSLGAVGGAALGAAQGAMIAGPVGAVVGGLTGLVGGLLGAGQAAKEAAERLKEMRKALDDSINDFRIQAQGGATLQDQIDSVRSNADSLRKEAYKDFPGNGVWYNPSSKPDPRLTAELQKIADAEATYIARLTEEARLKSQYFNEDLNVRALRAKGLSDEADALAFTYQQQREYTQAVKDQADASTLARLAEVQRAEAEKRAADAEAEAKQKEKDAAEEAKRLAGEALQKFRAARDLLGGIGARGFSALGDNTTADSIRFAIQSRQEMEQSIKDGMSPSTLAMLAFVQLLEKNQMDLQRNLEEQTKAINDAKQAQLDAIDREIAAVRLIADDQDRAYQKQIDVARATLDVEQDQLRTAEQAASETRRVFESLSQFGASLKLDTGLTVLSPISQLAEARQQYDDLLAKANSGDKDAAARLPDLARAFLEASRAVNASGPGYVSDFKRVQESLASVTDKFGSQLSVEERILAELQAQTSSLEEQLKASQDAKQAAQDAAQQQIAVLERAKEQAEADAQKQISELEKQLAQSQQSFAESFKYYSEFQSQQAQLLAESQKYFADSVAKLAGIIENTFKTAENTKATLTIWKGTLPIERFQFQELTSIVREGVTEQRETTSEQRAAVTVLQAGFQELVDRQDRADANLSDGLRRIERKLESLA